jgi:hypothetical protein
MDKVTPKDAFQANRDRAAPLLAKLKADGIGHIIDGKMVPSISGATFETKSPVDNVDLAKARGGPEDIDRAATAAIIPSTFTWKPSTSRWPRGRTGFRSWEFDVGRYHLDNGGELPLPLWERVGVKKRTRLIF